MDRSTQTSLVESSGRTGEAMPNPALTKLIATIGPASSSPAVVRRLLVAGVSVFRLNFSHGNPAQHGEYVTTIREAAEELGLTVGILGDLPGPKIRCGKVVEGGIDIPAGARVILQREPIEAQYPSPGQPVRLSSNHTELIDDVEPGQRVLINDGSIRMLAVEKNEDELICTVISGGVVSSRKGINLPDSDISINSLTEKDWRFVDWSLENGMDFLAMSFVKSAGDVRELAAGIQQRITARGFGAIRIPIIAKIELPKAVAHIESIVDAADAVMVARGDLGVEMDLARVPVIQKQILETAQRYGKPCIVATQLLESMMERPTPTRAEASDVANAIFDGADVVMLSGETAVGSYPVLAAEYIQHIAAYAEAHVSAQPARASAPQKLIESRYLTAALAHGVWTIVQDLQAKLIVVWSQQGGGARYLSQNNFDIPILAITSDRRAARQMQLLRGVRPVHMPRPENLEHFTQMVDAYVLNAGWAIEGEQCILMAGSPIGQRGVTNRIAVHTFGQSQTGFVGSD